jgi:hypothetical protein
LLLLGFSDHAFNAPTQQLRKPLVRPIFEPPSEPSFCAPELLEPRADKPSLRCRNRPAE